MPKISIIIPAYNAGRTIERAVKGVLSQSLRDLEVWVVNDGSSDNTGKLLDVMARQDTRIHVLHQENCGAFAARLNGLKHASGEYFGFLDADDHVEPQMYERMTSFAKDNNLDIVQCDLVDGENVGNSPELFLTRQSVLDKIVWPRLVQGMDSMLVWDKIYRNKYDVSSWSVENYWTGEDHVLNWRFFESVSRVGYLHEGFYHYTITASSSTRKFSDKTIPGFKATIRMRELLAKGYGLDPTDAAFAHWTLKNMRNLFVVAASAPAKSFGDRLSRADSVLHCTELENALKILPNDGVTKDKNRIFLKCCRMLPTWLIVVPVWLTKKIQRYLCDKN